MQLCILGKRRSRPEEENISLRWGLPKPVIRSPAQECRLQFPMGLGWCSSLIIEFLGKRRSRWRRTCNFFFRWASPNSLTRSPSQEIGSKYQYVWLMQPYLNFLEEKEIQTEEGHNSRRVSVGKPYESKITHLRIYTANSNRFGSHIQLKMYLKKRN